MLLTRPLQMHFACSFSHHFPLHLHRSALPPHELTHAEHCSSNVVIKKNGAHTNPTHSRRKHTSLSLQQYALFLDLPCKWKSMVIPCMYAWSSLLVLWVSLHHFTNHWNCNEQHQPSPLPLLSPCTPLSGSRVQVLHSKRSFLWNYVSIDKTKCSVCTLVPTLSLIVALSVALSPSLSGILWLWVSPYRAS